MPTNHHRSKNLPIFSNNEPLQQEIAEELTVYLYQNPVIRTHHGQCSRCGCKSIVNSDFPYCMDCNWDSLTDEGWGNQEGRPIK